MLLSHAVPGPAPNRFTAAGDKARKKLHLRKIQDDGPAIPGWQVGGNPRLLDLAGPTTVRADTAYKLIPAAGVPPGRTGTWTRLETVTMSVEVEPPLAPGAATNGTLFRLRGEGPFRAAQIPDPAGQPGRLDLPNHGRDAGDLVAIRAAAAVRFARVTATDGSGFTVDPPPGLAAPGPVEVQKAVATSRSDDKAENAAQAGDILTVEVPRSDLFAVGNGLLIEAGADLHVRTVKAVTRVEMHLVDPVVGNGPYTATPVKRQAGFSASGAELSEGRFVRHTGGSLPSTFGTYPDRVVMLPFPGPMVEETLFSYLRPTPAAAALLHTSVRRWRPFNLAGNEYWILEHPLPIEQADSGGVPTQFLRYDPDDPDEGTRRELGPVAGPINVTVREYARAAPPVQRPDVGGSRPLARPGHVAVPSEPTHVEPLGGALLEHELRHTIQNVYWGPLLGALPLAGLVRTVGDVVAATGEPVPDWITFAPITSTDGVPHDNSNINIPEIVSIGGIAQLLWKYVLLWPLLIADESRRDVLGLDTADFQRVFNPVYGALLAEGIIPEVDPDADADDRWGAAIERLFLRAMDLRTWIPIIGLVPAWLPDGPQNFLEQQASRESGDLYSTIVSADDRFNYDVRGRAGPTHRRRGADRTFQIGNAARLLLFPRGWVHRTIALERADTPVSPFTYYRQWTEEQDLRIEQLGGPAGLLHSELYEDPGGALATRSVDGPPSAPAPVNFIEAVPGTQLRPKLRAAVPVPAHVSRTSGCYLLAAAPGQYKINAYETGDPLFRPAAPAAENPKTNTVTVRFASEVKLGGDAVAWQMPAAAGIAPAPGTIPAVARFLTEREPLRVTGVETSQWEVQVDPPLAAASPRAGGDGWDIEVAHQSAASLPGRARVRLWAVIPKDSPVFDLTYDAATAPNLQGRRSYLEDPIWLPERDFHIEVSEPPALPDASAFADEGFEFVLPLKLTGPERLVVTRPAAAPELAKRRIRNVAPRGERWRVAPVGNLVEDEIDYQVKVQYGRSPNFLEDTFVMKFRPRFTLDKDPAVAAYEVRDGAPLELTVHGGTAPFRAISTPRGTRVEINEGTVTITATSAPAAAVRRTLRVEDGNDRKGARSFRLMP